MTSSGSVTQWIQLLQAGEEDTARAKAAEEDAARAIWERYFHRLVGLARAKLGGAAGCGGEEEDVALSVLDSFYRGLEKGNFPNLESRDNLWRLLVVLTARKAWRLVQQRKRLKNGSGNVRPEADMPIGKEERAFLDGVAGQDPSPEFAAQVAEECKRMLDLLGDGTLRSIACWKMEGHTNAEIGVKLGRLERTVERKLRRIRDLWENAP